MSTSIVSYLRINEHGIRLNGDSVFPDWQQLPVAERLPSLYRHLNCAYPKFFKMDSLCRAGFLAAELLARSTQQWQDLNLEKMAMVFSNRASSMDSDRKHERSIQNKAAYFPSPSVFVYTLPNIVLGEIAIRHKITGENAFFLSEELSSSTLADYTDLLLQTGTAEAALCGWINADGDSLDVLVYLVKTTNFKEQNLISNRPHNALSIGDLYKR